MGGIEAIGFIQTKNTNETDWPDIEYHFVTGGPTSDGGRQARKIHGLSEEVRYEYTYRYMYRILYVFKLYLRFSSYSLFGNFKSDGNA